MIDQAIREKVRDSKISEKEATSQIEKGFMDYYATGLIYCLTRAGGLRSYFDEESLIGHSSKRNFQTSLE